MEGFADDCSLPCWYRKRSPWNKGACWPPQNAYQKIVLSYDGDKAGQAAIAEELKDFSVEVVRVPDAMDPDEYLKNFAEDTLTKTD